MKDFLPMILKSPAKINLTLDVKEKRIDGYHNIETVMQTVSLYDEIQLLPSDKISVRTNFPYLPDDERNLAYRAAQCFFEKTKIKGGADIKINKKIPTGAGLGGGSSNAAAVIEGLNTLYNAGLDKKGMEEIGVLLGADVPFFFTRGACKATGLGEILQPIEHNTNAWTVIVKPAFSINTKNAYGYLDMTTPAKRPDNEEMVRAMVRADINSISELLCNVFEDALFPRYPGLREIKELLKKEGAAGALMTGSGSAVFGLFENKFAAQSCAASIGERYKEVFIAAFE
jgi:4-diphosphocytidyl-2-C-methyl-D-erythritol kinase